MDITELLAAFPQLAFGLICLWYLQQVQKERTATQERNVTQLAGLNQLYIDLLEKAVLAIANNANQSNNNGNAIDRIHAELVLLRADIGGIRERIDRLISESTKRGGPDSGESRTGRGAD